MLSQHPASTMFFADMLRCGSTHIEFELGKMLGWRPATVVRVHGEGQGEQNINPFALTVVAPYGYQIIGGHHVAYTETLYYLRSYNWRPVVCIRNLYDTVVSLKDRIDQSQPTPVIPGLRVPEEWDSFCTEDRYYWLAQNAVPWQLKFFVSWSRVENMDILWVNYNDFYADQTAGFKRILDFHKLPYPSDDALAAAASSKTNNFNVGVPGRGIEIPLRAREAIKCQVDSWGRVIATDIWGRLMC